MHRTIELTDWWSTVLDYRMHRRVNDFSVGEQE